MPLTTGSRLGPYEIRGVIDRGGMGEVYRATDTRLNRTVAIKVLLAARSQDATMRKRFAREAKALSNLHHPHICALYDVGETSIDGNGSVPYLVMEYLEGQTLDRLLRHGALPFDRVLRYGMEIADALHKAHRQHILHRDLKPSNIMITENGASLLDFGLAKTLVVRRDDSQEIRSDTSTDERSLTPSGDAIGTMQYMSPEQLQSKELDERADIFAFGICLYQMTTGHRPFESDSRAGLVASILKHEPPPPSSVRADVPIEFDWVIKRCIAKDPEERFQNVHDIKLELQRIAEAARVPRQRIVSRHANWWLTAIAGVLVVVVIALALTKWPRSVPANAVRRLSVTLPQAPAVLGPWEEIAVSPDGGHIAYVSEGNSASLWIYSLEDANGKSFPHSENARGPFFSPDGRWIGFTTADGLLKRVSVDGGEPITVGKTGDVRGATWGPQNEIVFGSTWSTLKKISVEDGTVTTLPQPNKPQFDSRWPVFLPDGKRVLFTEFDMTGDYDNSQVAVYDLSSGTTTPVLANATHGRLLGTTELIYMRSGTLFTVPFDMKHLKVTGDPVPRAVDVAYSVGSGLSHFAVSSDGTVFYVPHDPTGDNAELMWVDRRGKATSVSSSRRPFTMPRLSPDGTQILVRIDEGAMNDSLELYNIERQSWSPVTSVIGYGGVWSPDGKNVVFPSSRNGSINLFIMPIDRSTPPRQITHTTHWPYANSWSSDGRQLAIFQSSKDMGTDIYIVSVDGNQPPRPFVASPFNDQLPVFSPDGEWLAYEANDSGKYEVYVTRFPQNHSRWLVSSEGGRAPVWSRDGKTLFYRNGTKMMEVPVSAGNDFVAGKPRELFEGDFSEFFDVNADASKFLMVKRDKVPPQTELRVITGLAAH